jgi:hypothetical protein
MFEPNGDPIKKRFPHEGYEPRVGKVPCELSVGCPKGHWKDKPDLTKEQEATIKLFRASQATAGRCLTAAESQDYFLNWLFAELYEAESRITRMQTVGSIEGLIAAILTK